MACKNKYCPIFTSGNYNNSPSCIGCKYNKKDDFINFFEEIVNKVDNEL